MFKRLSCLVVFCAFALVPAAKADSASFTLSDPAQAGAPGTTFTYVGTISAAAGNIGDIFLNGDAYNLSGSSLVLNDTGFFSNFPAFLTPGESVTDVLFTVSSNASSTEGVNLGSFELLGGSDANTFNDLGSANFSAQVTPEPSSLVLLLTGAAGGFTALRRRRVQA